MAHECYKILLGEQLCQKPMFRRLALSPSSGLVSLTNPDDGDRASLQNVGF
jgi:hypothetical protein